MKIFRFDAQVGKEIEKFGSVNVSLTRILHLDGEAVISCAYIQPNGKIGYHQATVQQLFLVVAGEGWVRAESDQKFMIEAGQAAFWEKGEWHESGTETGMTAVILECEAMHPGKLMPPLLPTFWVR